MNIYQDYFYTPIFNLLIFLTSISGMNLAIGIILLVIIIKTILLYPSIKSIISQRKLQILYPQIKKIQDQYKDDRKKIAQETMKLYKENKINPSSGCLPLLLQFPFLIALYQVVYNSIPQQKDLLYPFLHNVDLNKINYIFLNIDITKHDTVFFPILLGVLTYLQMQINISKNSINMTEDQKNMQNIMLFLIPLMIAFMSMHFSIALSIYWLTSTLYTIFQTYIANYYINKKFPIHHINHPKIDNFENENNKKNTKKITKVRI